MHILGSSAGRVISAAFALERGDAPSRPHGFVKLAVLIFEALGPLLHVRVATRKDETSELGATIGWRAMMTRALLPTCDLSAGKRGRHYITSSPSNFFAKRSLHSLLKLRGKSLG